MGDAEGKAEPSLSAPESLQTRTAIFLQRLADEGGWEGIKKKAECGLGESEEMEREVQCARDAPRRPAAQWTMPVRGKAQLPRAEHGGGVLLAAHGPT